MADKEKETSKSAANLTIEAVQSTLDRSSHKLTNTLIVNCEGFHPGSSITAAVDSCPLSFVVGPFAPSAQKIKCNSEGVVRATILLPPRCAIQSQTYTLTVTDEHGTAADQQYVVSETPASVHHVENLVQYAGTGRRSVATVYNLPAGSRISYVGTDSVNFLHSSASLSTEEDPRSETDGFQVPDDHALLDEPIIVKVSRDDGEYTLSTSVTISLFNPEIHGQGYEVQSENAPGTLYVPALNSHDGSVYVTRSQLGLGSGYPLASQILRVDADTLKVIAAVDAPKSAHGFPIYAVFGLDIDESRGRIWVTNNLQGTVAVYKTQDLGLIHQYEITDPAKPLQNHAHQPVVDIDSGNVYVSGFDPEHPVIVIDGESLELATPPEISGVKKAAALFLDQGRGDLYLANYAGSAADEPKVVRYNIRDGEQQTFVLSDEDLKVINLTVDTKLRKVFVASQASDHIAVIDVEKAVVTDRIRTHAQPVYLTVDEEAGRLFVTNRVGQTVTIFDTGSHEMLSSVDSGIDPNGVALDRDGGVYVVSMKDRVDGGEQSAILHVSPK